MSKTTADYVVYVCFPSSSKEYAYLCNIPNLQQGDEVLANGTKVRIVRTANFAHQATKYVKALPSVEEVRKTARRNEIAARLTQLEAEYIALAKWEAVAKRFPEAKKLLAELKRLS